MVRYGSGSPSWRKASGALFGQLWLLRLCSSCDNGSNSLNQGPFFDSHTRTRQAKLHTIRVPILGPP